MNILHLKYAVEILKTGSINRASETLHIAQPNLSRAIKDLESSLNITIFTRTSRGMTLTAQGEEFITYAKTILEQIDSLEELYKHGCVKKQKFSISVPRSSYISDAFARFSNSLKADPAEIFYNETNSDLVIKNILEFGYHLGIIRYLTTFDHYYKELLTNKGLNFELIAEFKYTLLMHNAHPLNQLPEIHQNDLAPYIELVQCDHFAPSLSMTMSRKDDLSTNVNRRIFLFERGSQFDILFHNHQSFMWVSPLPKTLLEHYGLVQKPCIDNTKTFKDVLLYKKDYTLSPLDKQFITELCNSKRRCV